MKTIARVFIALLIGSTLVLPSALALAQSTGGGQTEGSGSTGGVSGGGSTGGGQTDGVGSTGGGQTGARSEGVGIFAPIKFSSVTDLINAVMEGVKYVGFIVGFVGIIYSGFLFVKAQGKPEELKVARMAFTWTIVGVFIILGAEILVQAIINTLFKGS